MWRSAAAAADALDAVRRRGEELDGARRETEALTPGLLTYGAALAGLGRLWSDVRLILGAGCWLRYQDIYNRWQVFTEGHEVQVRVTAELLAGMLSERLGPALPPEVRLRGPVRVRLMQPAVRAPGPKDLVEIAAPVRLEVGGAAYDAELTVVGFLSFLGDTAGRFVLVRAPRLALARPAPVSLEGVSGEIERALQEVRLLDRFLLSQLGDVRPFAAQTNQDLCLFGRLASPTTPGGPSYLPLAQVPEHRPLPSGVNLAVDVPRSTYTRAIVAPEGSSVFERGPVANPYGVGAERVEWFGIKVAGPMSGEVRMGSFGSYRYSLGPVYAFFHMGFETELAEGDARLVAFVRSAATGAVLSRRVIRTVAGVSAARVRLSDEGDLEFMLQRT